MGEIISKVIPIFVLILIGFFFKRKGYIKQESINELKKIVLNFGIPAVLFINFVNMEIKIEVLGLTFVNFSYLCLLFIIGHLLKNLKWISLPILPYLIPGLSFGTIGFPLLMSVFGSEAVARYSILGIAHELFIWFVLIVLLKYRFTGEKFSMGILKDLIKNPFIIAVLSGLLINLTGVGEGLFKSIIYNGLLATLDSLGSIVTPLILMILGYELKLNKKYITESAKVVILRLATMLSIGSIIKITILNRLLMPDTMFNYAWFTYLILPPSNSVPILLGQYSTEENAGIATNTTVLNTMVTILIYIAFVFYISQ